MASVGPCSPDELIGLVQAGDLHALDQITRCYGERLISAGRRYCRNEADAEDAVQDALLSAGQNLEQFRGDGPLEGWLVRMIANACRRMTRGGKNAPHQDWEKVPHLDASDDPEADAQRGQMAEALGHVLLSLTGEERLLLALSDVEEWKAPEIAERLGTTPGAVRTRLSRLHAKLRRELEPRWRASGM